MISLSLFTLNMPRARKRFMIRLQNIFQIHLKANCSTLARRAERRIKAEIRLTGVVGNASLLPHPTWLGSISNIEHFFDFGVYYCLNQSFIINSGNPSTIFTVSKLTVITCPIKRKMYCSSSKRFGSLRIPLPLAVLY